MHDHFYSRRNFLRAAGALSALAASAATPPAFAQSSSSPLRVLCGGPPGSIPDIVARRYSDQLSTRRPGGALVENRPGAAFQIAIGALKQAAPDGSTLLLAPGAIANVYPYLYSKLAYDPDADLKPVSVGAEATLAFAVGPAVAESVRTIADFVDWARANPRLANYGSPGQGTLPHMLSAMFFHEAKADAQHAAYAGGPPAIVDLIGGRIAALSLPEGLLRPHHEAKKLRVLATSGPARSQFMPETPTFVEQGYPGLVVREWFGFFMPGATPPAVVAAVSQTIRAAAETAPLVASFREMGMLAMASTPDAMAARIASERKYWREAIAVTGIRAEV